jgi:hypothetical protein
MKVRELKAFCRVSGGQGLLSAAIRAAEGLEAMGLKHHDFQLLPHDRVFVVRCLATEEDAMRVFNAVRTRREGGAFQDVSVARFYVNPASAVEPSSVIVDMGEGTHADLERLLTVVAETGLSFQEASASPSSLFNRAGFSGITAPAQASLVVKAVAALEEGFAGSTSAMIACVPSSWIAAAVSAPATSVVLRFPDHAGALLRALQEASVLPGVKQFLSATRLNAETFEAHLRIRNATEEDARAVIEQLEHLRNAQGVTDAFQVRSRAD